MLTRLSYLLSQVGHSEFSITLYLQRFVGVLACKKNVANTVSRRSAPAAGEQKPSPSYLAITAQE